MLFPTRVDSTMALVITLTFQVMSGLVFYFLTSLGLLGLGDLVIP